MTCRNLLQVIHIHPVLILFILIAIFTGTFVQLFILLCIVFIHEIGHYLAATYYRWRVLQIMLWVFGGVMKTDEAGNRPIKEEVIVTLAGPLQHGLIYLIIFCLSYVTFIPPSVIQDAYHFNVMILCFNLLPIYPLDGGKLFFLLLSSVLPYKKAHRLIILFSIIASIAIIFLQIFLLPFTLSAVLIMLFLLIENRTAWKQHYYFFMRFLLQRLQMGHNEFPNKKIVAHPDDYLMDVFAMFYRHKHHVVFTNQKGPYDEKKCLELYFKKKLYHVPMKEIIKVN